MPALTVISHYFNYRDRVERQIAHWSKIDPALLSRIEFILVDDCSDTEASLDTKGLNLRHFRITSDIPWNQAGARNLAAFHATGEWALFFDIDQQLHLDAAGSIMASLDIFEKDKMYYFKVEDNPSPTHPNTFLVNLKEYRTYGMYDEDFAGHYGYEDLYMPKVWERAGKIRVLAGDRPFFKELGFMTNNLERDSSRNQALAIYKMATGTRNSPGILRFDWKEIPPAA